MFVCEMNIISIWLAHSGLKATQHIVACLASFHVINVVWLSSDPGCLIFCLQNDSQLGNSKC